MTSEIQGYKNWIKVAVLSAIGGGLAGAFTAAMDPAKYKFPQDFGSGKLWEYFGQGALLTFGALLLKSPIGVKLLGTFKDTQAQLQQSQQTVQQTKAEIRAAIKPPEKKP